MPNTKLIEDPNMQEVARLLKNTEYILNFDCLRDLYLTLEGKQIFLLNLLIRERLRIGSMFQIKYKAVDFVLARDGWTPALPKDLSNYLKRQKIEVSNIDEIKLIWDLIVRAKGLVDFFVEIPIIE